MRLACHPFQVADLGEPEVQPVGNTVPLICRPASTSPLAEETDSQSYATLYVFLPGGSRSRAGLGVGLGKAVQSPAQMRSR